MGLAYVGVLAIVDTVVFGHLVPPLDPSGAWFYSGLLLILLGTSLVEPYFTRPADAVTNAVVALVAVLGYPDFVDPTGAPREVLSTGRTLLVFYSSAVLVCGILAISLRRGPAWLGWAPSGLARMAATAGSARALFSALYLASVFGAFYHDPGHLIQLTLLWITIVVVRPFERLGVLSANWGLPSTAGGEVVGVHDPGLASVKLFRGFTVQPGAALSVTGVSTPALVLDSGPAAHGQWVLLSCDRPPSLGAGVRRSEAASDHNLLGPIQPGTTLTEIVFRLPSRDERIREGDLVITEIRGVDVMYQVTGATVRRVSIESGIDLSYLELTARKIGRWDDATRAIVQVPWLPASGTLVRAAPTANVEPQRDCIGILPGSRFGIRLDVDQLVTHNCAVLGILGSGKTYLTFELIRRSLDAGVKVVVLDITGQYESELSDWVAPGIELAARDRIQAAIAPSRARVEQNVHEGGNRQQFQAAVAADLEQFLGGDQRLRVYNPAAFDVTRQDSKPYQGVASMAPLTVVETTRVFAEELLSQLSGELSDRARVCLVLEEAHSLVPEWNSTSYAGDQQAANGTAKAILQARKYGMGVILVTQRTANVMKSVLNQCNTVFALRIFDATGMEFLSNYIGNQYSAVLSSLLDRHAVIFGRGSSCASPVIIGLNEHSVVNEWFKPVSSGDNLEMPDHQDGYEDDTPWPTEDDIAYDDQ